MAIAAMIVERRFARKEQDDERCEERSDDEMFFDAVNGSLDELREIPHHPCVISGWKRRTHLVQAFANGLDHFDGVGARCRRTSRRTWACRQYGDGLGVGLAVLDTGDLADPDWMSRLSPG
jgi:hypothetical protein